MNIRFGCIHSIAGRKFERAIGNKGPDDDINDCLFELWREESIQSSNNNRS
jgi:hypothetical protein